MASLSDFNKSRVRHHLGYGTNAGIPAGYVEELEQAMDELIDEYQVNEVVKLLDNLDSVWQLSNPANPDAYNALETFAGDINRAKKVQDPRDMLRVWWEVYLAMSDRLAQILWVANFWQEENVRYRYLRGGETYIKGVPGPKDTSVGSDLYLFRRMA